MINLRTSTKSCFSTIGIMWFAASVVSHAAEISTAPHEQAPRSSQAVAVAPEGKTLPKGVGRARVVSRWYSGSHGYDGKGEQQDLGITHKMGMNAYIGEYGITDRLSLQVLVPQVWRHETTFDAEKFKRSARFDEEYEKAIKPTLALLQKNNLCHSEEQCRDFIDRHGSLSFPVASVMDTGESFSLAAHQPFKQAIEDTIVNNARPAEKGQTGLGDSEVGLLYSIYSREDTQLSAGLGARIPSGNSAVPEMSLPIGAGFWEGGLRVNGDYSPLAGLWLSLQGQSETALSKASWRRASLLNNQEFNEADAKDGGDNSVNNRQLKKPDNTYIGMAKINYGLGALLPLLNPLSLNSSVTARQDSSLTLDDKLYREKAQSYLTSFGAQASGLPYKLPLELSYNWTAPFAGKNKTLVDSYQEVSLKAYVLF